MAQVVETIDRRIDRTGLSALVAAGDVVLIGLFVAVGEFTHGSPPWMAPVGAIQAFVPFVLGWVLAALGGGLYTTDAWQSPLRALSWTVPAWIVAVLLTMAIRVLPFVPGGVAVTFVAVSIGVGLALLAPWRMTVAWLSSE